MPMKRKAGVARVANLLVARENLSTKRRKSTQADSDSDLPDERSDNEIVGS